MWKKEKINQPIKWKKLKLKWRWKCKNKIKPSSIEKVNQFIKEWANSKIEKKNHAIIVKIW